MTRSPFSILTDELDGEKAISAIEALNRAGWIIVRHDAIRLAQAHARDEAANDNREVCPFADMALRLMGA